MKLERRPLQLPDYAAAAMRQAIEVSGYSIKGEMHPGDSPEFSVTYADRRRPSHLLRFQEGAYTHHVHLSLMTAHMIERVWNEPPPRRYAATANRHEVLPPEYHLALLEHHRYNSSKNPDVLSARLRMQVLSRVLNYPAQIRVAPALLERFSDHFGRFKSFGRSLLAHLDRDFNPESLLDVPPALRAKYRAMSGALIEETCDVIDMAPGPYYRNFAEKAAVGELRHELRRVERSAHRGDREATNRWAQCLRIRFWYTWKRLQ